MVEDVVAPTGPYRLAYRARRGVWTGALPNLIADYVVVPEYINEVVRAGSLTRWAERLSTETLQRSAMLEGFDRVWQRLETERPPGEMGASIVLDILRQRAGKPGVSI